MSTVVPLYDKSNTLSVSVLSRQHDKDTHNTSAMGLYLFHIRFCGIHSIHSHHRYLVDLVQLQALQHDKIFIELWLGLGDYALPIQPEEGEFLISLILND